ncbi:MAG: hypothetical protein QOI98_2505, partial [Solirubrobacteraceae bacterium]|nr:hypothetical protein [Solirubrobacteraceae bacterium]
ARARKGVRRAYVESTVVTHPEPA